MTALYSEKVVDCIQKGIVEGSELSLGPDIPLSKTTCLRRLVGGEPNIIGSCTSDTYCRYVGHVWKLVLRTIALYRFQLQNGKNNLHAFGLRYPENCASIRFSVSSMF